MARPPRSQPDGIPGRCGNTPTAALCPATRTSSTGQYPVSPRSPARTTVYPRQRPGYTSSPDLPGARSPCGWCQPVQDQFGTEEGEGEDGDRRAEDAKPCCADEQAQHRGDAGAARGGGANLPCDDVLGLPVADAPGGEVDQGGKHAGEDAAQQHEPEDGDDGGGL